MIAPQKVATPCPYCRAVVPVEIHSIIDVGQNPPLKNQFLAGRLNAATCPSCRRTFQVGGALLYHDGSKQFLGIYLPHEINLANKDRQRIIGDLNRRLMDSLPPDQRRAYLFQPKEFITLNGLIEAILAADGITPEMQRAQRQRMQLLETIMRSATSIEALQAAAKEYDQQLDREFFELIAGMAEQSAADGDTQSANLLAMLYQQMLPMTSFGAKIVAQQQMISRINERTTREELLEMILASDEDQVRAIALVGRPLLDYNFFQKLTGRIERAQTTGDGDAVQRLTALREDLLALIAEIDQYNRQMFDQAVAFLRELLQAPDPATALMENLERVDDVFVQVLETNYQAAMQRGNQPMAERLQALLEVLMQQMRQEQPSEVQLLNELLAADFPAGARALLAERKAEMTPKVLDMMLEVAGLMEAQGQAEPARRLRDVHGLAVLMG